MLEHGRDDRGLYIFFKDFHVSLIWFNIYDILRKGVYLQVSNFNNIHKDTWIFLYKIECSVKKIWIINNWPYIGQLSKSLDTRRM